MNMNLINYLRDNIKEKHLVNIILDMKRDMEISDIHNLQLQYQDKCSYLNTDIFCVININHLKKFLQCAMSLRITIENNLLKIHKRKLKRDFLIEKIKIYVEKYIKCKHCKQFYGKIGNSKQFYGIGNNMIKCIMCNHEGYAFPVHNFYSTLTYEELIDKNF